MRHSNVLILGGGSAGSVLASRLSADSNCRVTVLEAGSHITDPDVSRPEFWPFIQGREYDWSYSTVPQGGLAGRRLKWPRGLGWGGSSNLHAMAHMRGSRGDFARWAASAQDNRWSWDAMLPVFRKMESYSTPESADHRLHGQEGPMPVMMPGKESLSPLVASWREGWEELGAPSLPGHNTGAMTGVTPNALTIKSGKRVTTYDAYVSAVRHRENLTLYGSCKVNRLIVSRGTATGVEVRQKGKSEVFTADHIILCLGAIGDPLVLMRSGIGDAEHIAAHGINPVVDLKGVGANLHDHLLGAGNLYHASKNLPQSKLQLSEAMTYLSAHGISSGVPEADVVVGCSIGPTVSDALADGVEKAMGEAFTFLFGVTHPTSRGQIRLRGAGLDDHPMIDPKYMSTTNDKVMFRQAFRYARAIGRTKPILDWRGHEVLPGPSVADEDDRAVDEFITRAAVTHHHPVGTCRMGADEESVVTPDLHLRGLDNVSIVDASIIPEITTGPVHAPVLAIAEAFAEWFRRND